MDKKGITVHMVVKNEDRFIWYAISSVLPYVKQIIIYDTGSTDNTVSIIKLFKTEKIIFRQKKIIDELNLIKLRQEQINMTRTDWLWIMDGDEIYPEKTTSKVCETTENSNLYGIIVHRYDLLGDIYHYQDESVGTYNQFGIKGHYVLRLINKKNIGGLQVLGKYPDEYFADSAGKSVKKYGEEKFAFIKERVFHAMYLKRSSRGANLINVLNRRKRKIEVGNKIDERQIPEIFFKTRPKIVPEVTEEANWGYKMLASVITPVKQIKRRIVG